MSDCDPTGHNRPGHNRPGHNRHGHHWPENVPFGHAPSGHAAPGRPARRQPLQASAFLETIIRLLMPYFLDTAGTVAGARIEILRTLASYGACTRPGVLLAAQVIALGVTTLDALHEARTIEMSVPMRLRYRSNANSLTRTMLRTEDSLLAALDDEAAAEPVATKPAKAEPGPAEPVPTPTELPPAEPTAAEPMSAEPASAEPASAEPGPIAARAAATVMDAVRGLGLALPLGAAPTGRTESPPPPG